MSISSHLGAAKLCDKAYDTTRSDIWSVRETDALVRAKEDCVKINFRGTEFSNSWPRKWSREALSNTRDVIKDLRIWPWRSAVAGWVHKGFGVGAEHWASVYALRLARLDLPLEISGHSLGASIAAQVAPLLHSMGFDVREVVVFGEPASFYFGSEDRYRKLNIPTWSYLNEDDWIQLAPPWGETAVPRTWLNYKPGISRPAHDIKNYINTLSKLV